MSLTPGTKYAISNLALSVLLFLIYKYYVSVQTSLRHSEQQAHYVMLGLGLYMLVGLVAVFGAYYRGRRRDIIGQSRRASELGALGMLAGNSLKQVHIRLDSTVTEYKTLMVSGTLVVAPTRFTGPIRDGDIVDVCIDDANTVAACVTTEVAAIDGYNQTVTLQRSDKNS